MTTTDRLDAIEARANAATEGPWRWTNELRQRLVTGDNPDDLTDARELIRCAALMHPGQADAAFIAHARTDVPTLVAALRGVLDLHGAVKATWAGGVGPFPLACSECSDIQWVQHPCPTVAAITAALTEVTR